MKYDAIIFDIDGTLWNACDVSARGMNDALQKMNIPAVLTAEDIARVSGKPFDQVFHALFGELINQYPEIPKRATEGERKAIEEEGGRIFEGVFQGMKKLSQASKIFLVSNCEDWYLEAFKKYSKLSEYVTHADCYGISRKTKADMIQNIIKTHHIKHAVYIGDTLIDQTAAELAGVDFIGAAYGFGTVQTAEKRFESFTEILQYLSHT